MPDFRTYLEAHQVRKPTHRFAMNRVLGYGMPIHGFLLDPTVGQVPVFSCIRTRAVRLGSHTRWSFPHVKIPTPCLCVGLTAVKRIELRSVDHPRPQAAFVRDS